MDAADGSGEGEEEEACDKEDRFSRSVFSYRKRPDCRWECNVGSLRACAEAILISVVDGSMASIDDALVGVYDEGEGDRGIVRASDSAKIPPPHPISRYFNPDSPSLSLTLLPLPSSVGESVVSRSERGACDRGPCDGCSERQEPIKSCRNGFIR